MALPDDDVMHDCIHELTATAYKWVRSRKHALRTGAPLLAKLAIHGALERHYGCSFEDERAVLQALREHGDENRRAHYRALLRLIDNRFLRASARQARLLVGEAERFVADILTAPSPSRASPTSRHEP